MTFWAKSVRIFKGLCAHGTQSVRQVARTTGLSKSRVHRLTRAMQRRDSHPESWWWETPEGRQWLTRWVLATLYTFGLKRGVGLDTISALFVRWHLATQVGCSASALRGGRQTLEAARLETAGAWEQEGQTSGEVRESIGAVDATFLERMIVVCMDLPTGSLLLEAVAEDRTSPTWKALVEERLTALGAHGLSVVSDRAKALMQLAETGLECLSMPDFFHVIHDIVQSYARAIGQRWHHAQQERTKAQAALGRRPGRRHADQDTAEAQALVAAWHAEVTRGDEAHHRYRGHLAHLSLTLHPFRLADSTPQTAAQVASQLTAPVEAIEAFAQYHTFPARHDPMAKVRKQVPALAALRDCWWDGGHQDLEPFRLSPRWQQWVYECLLPMVYWATQVPRTRCRRRKAKIQEALEAVRTALELHPITQRLAPHVLAEWQAWATDRVKVLQRTSSAVEGRNGMLSQLHHNQRGLPKQRYKVWTVLHNFDCHAADGTTPAARFFRRSFPDLFETVLSQIENIKLPYAIEVTGCPALSGYPVLAPIIIKCWGRR